MSVEKVWHIMGEVDGKKIYLASRYDQKAAFKAAVEFSHRWPRVIIEHPKEE